MELSTERAFDNFNTSYRDFLEATDLIRQEKATKLASQIDILSQSRDGLTFLFEKSVELEKNGLFQNTAWNEPDKLVPSLVKGTLRVGHPSSSFEIVSELRMLAIAGGLATSEKVTRQSAQEFLEEVLVHNLEFAFNQLTEESRTSMTEREVKKANNLMGFIISEMDLEGVYGKLAQEIMLICEQRPVMTRKARELIRVVNTKIDVKGNSETDKLLIRYLNAVYHPSEGSIKYNSIPDYHGFLQKASGKKLASEAEEMGYFLKTTGLASSYQAMLLKKLAKEHDHLIPVCLNLTDPGIAEWEKHQEFVSSLIEEVVSPDNCQCVYGLARMLERGLFSRREVRVGLENIKRIKLNPQVERRILRSLINPEAGVSALQYLIGGTIKVLGQPLGIGQGNNPTCQSARGISMWSQHAPAKLLDMIITVATQNNLIVRFENQDLESIKLAKGLMDNLDYDLDVVSVLLVPHLDKIYNEMMLRATGRGEDPHKWVNPAMYGQWIQVGFASVYDYLTNSIMDFEGFVRIFYAAFHPTYNGDRQMSYPNPVGIFITSSKGEMVGFHAVSLLRIGTSPTGEMRAYFLNPNNEGRQNWGQGINPSVYGLGEKHGESSLPVHEFASRLYAFHYNQLDVTPNLIKVPEHEILKVEKLAKESWGKSYIWSQQSKLW